MIHQLATVAPQAAILAAAMISGSVLTVDLVRSARRPHRPIGPIVEHGQIVDGAL